MSLGGGPSATLDNAITNARERFGVLTVVAAGNENQNACNVSPARAEAAFTIGASDINDRRASFSNFGDCVGAFGPGVQINSIRPNSRMQYMSGTSMACPVVVGITSYEAAYDGAVSPDEILDAMLKRATEGHIQDSKSKNDKIPFGGDLRVEEFLQ